MECRNKNKLLVTPQCGFACKTYFNFFQHFVVKEIFSVRKLEVTTRLPQTSQIFSELLPICYLYMDTQVLIDRYRYMLLCEISACFVTLVWVIYQKKERDAGLVINGETTFFLLSSNPSRWVNSSAHSNLRRVWNICHMTSS